MTDQPTSRQRGELLARFARYLAAAGVGYLGGLVAASSVPKGPPFYIAAIVGAVVLFAAFRRGRASVTHVVQDWTMTYNAKLADQINLTAAPTQIVQVGHHQVAPTLPLGSRAAADEHADWMLTPGCAGCAGVAEHSPRCLDRNHAFGALTVAPVAALEA